jgi:hypothetical protein
MLSEVQVSQEKTANIRSFSADVTETLATLLFKLPLSVLPTKVPKGSV